MIMLLKSLRQILTSVSETPTQEDVLLYPRSNEGDVLAPLKNMISQHIIKFLCKIKETVFLKECSEKHDCEDLNKGFTLIEVALAIAILGIGLATITTLSTRLVDDTFYEVGRSRGTILALYILETEMASSASNTNSGNAEQNQAGSLNSKLEGLGFFSGLNKQTDFPYLNDNWSYELTFQPLNLPVSETNFNIITCVVRWGNSDFDTVHLQTISKSSRKTSQPGAAASPSPST